MPQKVKILQDTDEEAHQRFLKYTDDRASYISIATECISPGSRVTFCIYSLHEQALVATCSASISAPIVISDEMTRNCRQLFIESDDLQKYISYLSEIMKKYPPSSPAGTAVLQEKSRVVMKEVFEQPIDSQKMRAVMELSSDMVECVLTRDEVLFELLTIKRQDYQVYVHSVNVAVFSLALGKLLGLDKQRLRDLGIGAFLHDIGKRDLPKKIMGKIGLLTDAEYKIYKKHVLQGVRLLESTWKVPTPSIVAVSQHHERINGMGYPNGLANNQVELFGRILSIADCFDNLISPRPNKFALKPFDAANVLVGEKGSFDQEILTAFVKMLGRA